MLPLLTRTVRLCPQTLKAIVTGLVVRVEFSGALYSESSTSVYILQGEQRGMVVMY